MSWGFTKTDQQKPSHKKYAPSFLAIHLLAVDSALQSPAAAEALQGSKAPGWNTNLEEVLGPDAKPSPKQQNHP